MGNWELSQHKGMIESEGLLCCKGDSCYASNNSCVHSHCVWLRKPPLSACQEALPDLLSAEFIISLLFLLVHQCTAAGHSIGSQTHQIQQSGWISRECWEKIHWEETTTGQWVCGHSFPALPVSAVFMCHSHAGYLLPVST